MDFIDSTAFFGACKGGWKMTTHLFVLNGSYSLDLSQKSCEKMGCCILGPKHDDGGAGVSPESGWCGWCGCHMNERWPFSLLQLLLQLSNWVGG